MAVVLACCPWPASAQPLGTFTWQLQPFCNRVTVAVTRSGDVYTLDGYDDACGSLYRLPVVGTAHVNADGSIGMGLHTMTSNELPVALGGRPVHVYVLLSAGSVTGSWNDSMGNSGGFVFGGSSAGSPRPRPPLPGSVVLPGVVTSTSVADGTLNASDINPSEIQRRVTGACAAGLFFSGIADTGAATCSDGAPGGFGAVSLGTGALGAVTTGNSNTAVGDTALSSLTTGSRNVALGARALMSGVSVNSTVAIGSNALMNHTSGDGSIAIGQSALATSTSGFNIGIGQLALTASTTSLANVAIGSGSMQTTTTGSNNVAGGHNALSLNVTGGGNVAVGQAALEATTGSNNTALGRGAGLNQTTGSNNVTIGANVFGVAGDSGVIRIGDGALATRTHVAGITGRVVPNGVPVLVDGSHQLGVQVSSRRFKQDIEDMREASRRIFELRPVTFRYVQAAVDGSKPLEFGLIAEEVAEVFPELAVAGGDGQIETVAYHKLPALLLNELQKQQQLIESLSDRLAVLESLRVDVAAARAAPAHRQ